MKMRDCPSGCGTVDMYVNHCHLVNCVLYYVQLGCIDGKVITRGILFWTFHTTNIDVLQEIGVK